jgi:ABC-type thiamine transport system ATPase subunit
MHGDHILPRHPRDPRIPRGPDVPANVRALCGDCNRRKSNRITTLPDGALRRAMIDSLRVFARLYRVGVPVQPLRPTIAPHVSTLRFATVPGHAHVRAATMSEVRAAIDTEHARVYVHGAELRVELPRWPRRPVPLRDMPRRGLRLGIGLDVDNRPVGVDFDASPHLLIAGQSGSGKSVLLQTIVHQLAAAGAHLVLVDADGHTFEPFARLAALEVALARDVDTGHNAAVYVQRAMDARPIGTDQPAMVLAVDEIHTLRQDTRAVIQDIAQRGRKRRVFVVVATHRPVREVLTPTLTDQCTWRVAGRVQTPKASELIIGQSGAQHLGPAGDMLLAHGGHVVRFQAARGGSEDWARLPMRATEPAAAPVATVEDPRYVRKPDDEAVRWAVERAVEDGRAPSATAIHREFGGAMDAARRRRDIALQVLATA